MKVFLVLSVLIASALGNVLPRNVFKNAFEDWESRIVGGQNATVGQFPYQVSVRTDSGNVHFCGGWIHNNRWIVTAAHCTVGRTTSNTKIATGAHYIMSGTLYALDQITNHPSYDAAELKNDIALIKTSTSIVFSTLVGSITLNTYANVDWYWTIVSGWGYTKQSGDPPSADYLQYLEPYTISLDYCRDQHDEENRKYIYDNTVCTMSDNSAQGVCRGDSGGPLVIGPYVIGAVSWGIPCAQGKPDVYARVSFHVPWIISVI